MLCVALLPANPATAQSVRVQNGQGEWGFGWMFGHAGICHVVMPRHVAQPDDAPFAYPKVTVSTAAPVVTDGATIDAPFWEGIDLATAVVDAGPLDARCTASLSDLEPTRETRATTRASLVRVTGVGEVARHPLRVGDWEYLTFQGELMDDGASIAQGTSGAFAFVGDRPIGMALTSTGERQATFMRSEEIAINVGRRLAEVGQTFVGRRAAEDRAPIAGDGIAVRAVSANLPALLPQYEAENVLGEGLFVAEPTGPLEITLRLGGDAAQAVRRVRMTAPQEGYAVPRSISVLVDAGEGGHRFRPWTGGQMRPDGVFDTGLLAPRNARWVRLRITDAWGSGAVALDRVVVE